MESKTLAERQAEAFREYNVQAGLLHQYPTCCVKFYSEQWVHLYRATLHTPPCLEAVALVRILQSWQDRVAHGAGYRLCPDCLSNRRVRPRAELFNMKDHELWTLRQQIWTKHGLEIPKGMTSPPRRRKGKNLLTPSRS